MLMPNPSLRSVIFWQFANQTLNVAVCISFDILTPPQARNNPDEVVPLTDSPGQLQ